DRRGLFRGAAALGPQRPRPFPRPADWLRLPVVFPPADTHGSRERSDPHVRRAAPLVGGTGCQGGSAARIGGHAAPSAAPAGEALSGRTATRGTGPGTGERPGAAPGR